MRIWLALSHDIHCTLRASVPATASLYIFCPTGNHKEAGVLVS